MNGGIRLRGLTKRYGATIALAGVDLDLRPGEVLRTDVRRQTLVADGGLARRRRRPS
jgi:ABC-type phosphonate transport system ATPase subunit